MKKVMILAAAAMVFGLVGCSKTKDCKCTITQTMSGVEVPSGMNQTTEVDMNDYDGNCEDITLDQVGSFNGMGGGYTQTISCKEK